MQVKSIKLWSKRWSTSYGWHWKLERYCEETTKKEWLEVFQKSEPGVEFKLSKVKPKIK